MSDLNKSRLTVRSVPTEAEVAALATTLAIHRPHAGGAQCDSCGEVSETNHIVEVSDLNALQVVVPFHQKITLYDTDGNEVISVMNQCGDMVVWLNDDNICEVS